MSQLSRLLGQALAVLVGLRLLTWWLEPVLMPLLVLVVLAAVLSLFVGRGRTW